MFDTKEAFLIDTLNYYLGNVAERRCIGFIGTCKYSSIRVEKPNSEGCAIGRHIPDEEVKMKLDTIGGISAIFHTNNQHLLPEWMVAFGKDFLQEVQMLHDASVNWDIEFDKLSKLGQISLSNIIKEFELDGSFFTKYLDISKYIFL